MDTYTADELQEALRPIVSLISKSQKAQQKVAPGMWQYAMLQHNLEALHAAYVLMTKETDNTYSATQNGLLEAIRAFASMIDKTEKAQTTSSLGTSQCTLLRNRLEALHIGKKRLQVELERIYQQH